MKLCDYGCGKEAKYQFKNGVWCCSESYKSCQQVKEKIRQTFMEKYGVENPSQNKEVQNKMRQTNMEKYRAEHPSQNKKVQEKMKQTCMEKYGIENPFQSKEFQKKIKQTNIERYGVDHHFKNKEIQEKRKQTFIEKYGVVHPSQNKEVQEKMKQTCLEKYGVDSPLKNKEVQEKMKQTCMEKYGVNNPSKNKEIQEKRKKANIAKYGASFYWQSIEAKKDLLKKHPFLCQVEEIKIEDNQLKVHCKNSNCVNSKEKRGWFTPTPTQIHNRIGELEDETGGGGCFFYCSQYCKTTCKAFNVHSDPEKDTQLPYTQEQYQTFRLHVLTRDNYICQFCGAPATDVHHEIPVKLQPFFAVDPDYAWSCCGGCHYAKGHPQGTSCSTGNLAAVVCKPVKKKEKI